MRALHYDIYSALVGEVQTLTRCLLITRTDGIKIGLTESDQDLAIDGVTYRASAGLSPSAVQVDTDFAVNNLTLRSLFSEDLTEADLRRGAFDYARIELFAVNFLALPTSLAADPPKHLTLLSGVLGKISHSDSDYEAELMGLTRFLEGRTSEVASKTCRYNFGDSRCTVNPVSHQVTGQVGGGSKSPTHFESSLGGTPDDRFTGGSVTFTGGELEGLTFGVIKQISGTFYVSGSMPSVPAENDPFTAIPNCQKRPEDCKRYNNYINFGGEELVGLDAYYSAEEQ